MNDDTEVHRALGRIEGKMDGLIAFSKQHTDRMDGQDTRMDKQDERIDATDARVSKIENKLMFYGGIAAATVFFAGKIDFGTLFSMAAEAMTK